MQHENGQSKVINCDDSNQRLNNIHQLFNHHHKQGKFSPYLNKQKDEALNKQDLIEMKELLLQIARLPLVNNCESVLCAIYIYHQHKLIDASVAVDNMFAQNKELNEFRQLRF